jgi:acyl carrier protein
MTTGSTPSNGLTLTDALGWIAEMFEEPRANISPSTARTDIPAWDSLGQLILMSGLDQRFGIRLTQDELTGLGSVQDILDVLTRHHRLIAG